MLTAFPQTFRRILTALPVIALCGLLTLPVLAAPLDGSGAPGFLARIWGSIESLVPGWVPPSEDPAPSELRAVAGDAGPRTDPVGNRQSLWDETSSTEESLTGSMTVVPEDPLDAISGP